jgi:hypothetical protein
VTIESRQFDVLSVLTGVFALAYIGGAVFGVVSGEFNAKEFVAIVGAPGLPLIGYWVRGKQ